MNAVGGHIRRLRRKADMTQQTLAERLNVTRQAVSQWENGNTQPDLDTLAAIADVFGVDMMEVIYGEKRMETSGTDPERRKQYLTGLIVFGTLALVMWIVFLFIRPLFIEQQSNYYYMPTTLYMYYAEPLLYLFIPMAVLYGCSLVWDIRIRHKSIRLSILIAVVTYVLIHYAAGVLYLRDGELPWLVFDYQIFFLKNRAIFLIPGIGLFLGLNGRRTEPKATAG